MRSWVWSPLLQGNATVLLCSEKGGVGRVQIAVGVVGIWRSGLGSAGSLGKSLQGGEGVRQGVSSEDLFGCCVEFGFCEGGGEREEMNLDGPR